MAVKVNVSLPEDVLEKIDRAARESHSTRSGFLLEAVRSYLRQKDEELRARKRLEAAAEIDRFREKYGGWDGTAEVLRWRDLH